MSTRVRATRHHDISTAHRLVGHEGRCRHIHGHNYRIHFTCEADELDETGRVLDFSVIKDKLCEWVEQCWDHRLMLWDQDPLHVPFATIDDDDLKRSVLPVPFNPTAENMALYLYRNVGPRQLKGTNVHLVVVTIEETGKCLVTVGE